MFDFLQHLIIPLWVMVAIVFVLIIVLISKTIIKSAKLKQKGFKEDKKYNECKREIEPLLFT